MQIRQNLMKLLLLGLFAFSAIFVSSSVGAATDEALPLGLNYEKYNAGTLLKAKGVKGGAVYQLASDGKKYVYPDKKTFDTWYENFSQVVEVPLEVLEEYADGGTVTVQPGTVLLTHPNTAKVYAVGEDGELVYISSEAVARKFYGENWYELVKDIDPGIFAISYRIRAGVLSENNLPTGSLVKDEDSNTYFLIENGQKRKISTRAFSENKLYKRNVIRLRNFENLYEDGDEVEVEEEDLTIFNPGLGKEKILICHKPTVASAGQGVTIRVSEMSLKAHLAHGDTRGACGDDDEDDDKSTVDLKMRNITMYPVVPDVDEEVIITLHIENTGNKTLTSMTGIDSIYKSFEDFQLTTTTPDVMPDVSESNPLSPGEKTYYAYKGSFTSGGEKKLEAKVDYDNDLAESNETNNSYSIKVRVDEEVALAVCDHNSDGKRDLVDISLFGQCAETFDANGDGVHDLTDLALYGVNNQDDSWCQTNFVCVPVDEPVQSLAICDHNGDGLRDLSDVAMFSQCAETFDANGDGVHDIADISLYSANNQDDDWCETVFMCVPVDEPVQSIAVCDHTGDGVRDILDVSFLGQCLSTFDANGDGVHDLTDVALYGANNQDDNWCESNFVCQP